MFIRLQLIKKYEQGNFFQKTFGEIKNSSNFAPLSRRKHWKDGRVVDYTGLENRRAERHRGFESLSFRGRKNERIITVLSFFCFLSYLHKQVGTEYRITDLPTTITFLNSSHLCHVIAHTLQLNGCSC